MVPLSCSRGDGRRPQHASSAGYRHPGDDVVTPVEPHVTLDATVNTTVLMMTVTVAPAGARLQPSSTGGSVFRLRGVRLSLDYALLSTVAVAPDAASCIRLPRVLVTGPRLRLQARSAEAQWPSAASDRGSGRCAERAPSHLTRRGDSVLDHRGARTDHRALGVSNRIVMPNPLNRFSLQPTINSKPSHSYWYN